MFTFSNIKTISNAVIFLQYFKHVQQHIMYKHETKKPWKCDQCDYAHALQKGLQEHVRNCHPKESDLKVCHICGYKTTINHNLKEHIERTHEKKRRFTCNLCDAHFYRKSVMERHVRGNFFSSLKYSKQYFLFSCLSSLSKELDPFDA